MFRSNDEAIANNTANYTPYASKADEEYFEGLRAKGPNDPPKPYNPNEPQPEIEEPDEDEDEQSGDFNPDEDPEGSEEE